MNEERFVVFFFSLDNLNSDHNTYAMEMLCQLMYSFDIYIVEVVYSDMEIRGLYDFFLLNIKLYMKPMIL